jgi:hypothetical protein
MRLFVIIAVVFIGCAPSPTVPAVISLAPQTPTTSDSIHVEMVSPAILSNGTQASQHQYRWFLDNEEIVDLIGDSVPSLKTSKGQIWEVRVAPIEDLAAVSTSTAVIENTAPEVTISLSPAEASTNDDISVIAETTDENGDEVTLSYSWSNNGVTVAEDGPTLAATETTMGETWTVLVTPSDTESSGNTVSLSISISNSAPVISAVEILPEDPVTMSELSAIVTASDSDNDDIEFSYEWRVNGLSVQSGIENTLASSYFEQEDFIDVLVLATDGLLNSAPFQSSVVLIKNTPPEILGVSISPENPTSSDSLKALASGHYDADGDPVMYSVNWYINQQPATGVSVMLSPSYFERGDWVYAEMSGNDGYDTGPPVESDIVVIANSLPSEPGIVVEPENPLEGEALVCSVETEAADVDGDALSYTFSWWVDGVDSGDTGGTLPQSTTVAEEEWTCRVVANDGYGEGDLAEVSVEVE